MTHEPGRQGARARSTTAGPEWVGGRFVAPFWITEGEPYRPEMLLWCELPAGVVVAFEVLDPRERPVDFGASFLEATRKPMVGRPRKPRRVRVADERLAAELRAACGAGLEIRVAPTPELDEILELLASTGPGGDEPPSYLESGRVPEETIAALFSAARVLWTVAPWKSTCDDQVLRLDIPEYGIRGAVVSIIGILKESIGFVIFPDFRGFEAFVEFGEQDAPPIGGVDFGTTVWSFTYERGADLPASMRREVKRHGWPVAGPKAYPVVEHRDRDGVPRPLTKRDVEIVAACAMSLATFCIRNESIFESDSSEPVSMTFANQDDLAVRFTYPYEAYDLFEEAPQPHGPAPSAARAPRIGRNDPCPCGSGKKYKKCCLALGQDQAAPDRGLAPIHEVDARLLHRMRAYAERRFESAWRRSERDFTDAEKSAQLSHAWSVHHFEVDGRPVVEWFLAEHRAKLTPEERSWLESQRRAWLSIWEVLEVEPGSGFEAVDLLSGEKRHVREVSGSRTLGKRDAFLARIVDQDGESVLAGVHPRTLPPRESAEVVRLMRSRLRRRREVPIERLRSEAIGRHMIARWEEAVEESDRLRAVPPKLQNTNGEEFVLVTDRFDFDPGMRKDIGARLAKLEGASAVEMAGEKGSGETTFDFVRPGNAVHAGWETTVVGRAWLGRDALRVETNSIRRADALRRRVQAACGELIRHRSRDRKDAADLVAAARRPEQPTSEHEQPPELAELLREYKERFYADWVDQPVPALGGKTPREAARLVRGRAEVDLLLKSMEHHEARLPEPKRFDFGRIRRQLGLDG